ncbi:coiled-coil domain-containing protein AGAP005037 isoform X11 [Thrips palmi]|uniref:Coiled-coil domain-containing protein AGAP005037 isoform X11 n=1 Tax=Thrips palmi TaxID=161013 RepID=A0A6P8YQN5_THRPL|nr:coiled-coil domain-containing protein AGAP005037 isoform X11 [Thrips palmi]
MFVWRQCVSLDGERSKVHDSGSHERRHRFSKRSEEEWGVGGKGRGPGDLGGPPGGSVRGDEEMRRGGGRGGRRDDPRRHTLGGDQHPHPPQGGTLSRSMDLEMSAKQRKKSPMARGYPPPSNAMLFDDDPGIMSEVETASTGFHRGGKQRSSLPVVRTPSKTLERPLGLVFLQYRSETKRALLPNEITSLDTVKALFVRSFCKQLTMEYLDSPLVKIYIHDSNKDMFYELEDHRSHLRDIRDRSVLRLFESTDVHSGVFPGAGTGLAPPPMWEADQSYFSEPEFDSEYQHQHIHKSKASKASGVPPQPYYMTHSFPPGGPPGAGPGASATLPRGGSMLRAYSPAPKNIPPSDRIHAESGYMSSPERGGPRAYPSPAYPSSAAVPYEEGYYGQYGTRSGSITPVIDEEASDTELMDEQYALYGVKLPGPGSGPRGPPAAARAPFPTPAGPPYDVTRIRVENMERQLANLTGLVQKALTHGPTHLAVPGSQGYRNASGEFDTHAPCSSASQDDPTFVRSDVKPPKLGKDKSVSFEKSVSFSDEPPDMNSPKQHSPQHGADTKPTKPAIKSSTLPRTSSQERDRHKPAPPPKPMSLSPGQYEGRNIYRDLQLTPEMYNQLRGLQKKAKDLRQEVRNLRRMSQAQAHSVRETIRDTFIKIRAMLITGSEGSWAAIGDAEKLRLSREEELYKQEMIRLEKDLTELESTVEELRGNVINRKTRVNMSDVENMALILSKSSKTVADLKVRFPGLQDEMKSLLSSEMDKVMREEKFLKEEPERLESALRRCKKLTGTLVTLKRLASVQEQRLPGPPGAVGADARLSPTLDDEPLPPTPNSASSKACIYGSARNLAAASDSGGESSSGKRPENALDALLDELQTFAKPPASNQTHPPTMAEIGRRKGSIEATNPPASNPTSSLRRLHSYPSSSDGGGNSPPNIARLQVSDSKPPVPERNADLLAKRVPPPPPPRTSSRSPLASPTSPSLPPRTQNPPSQPQMGTQGTLRRAQAGRASGRSCSIPGADPLRNPLAPEEPSTASPTITAASNSSSCESVNSQEGAVAKKERQEALEQRHQELLRKQRALQEQYARLQQLQRGTATVPTPDLLLKKTGSESNLLAKMGMQGLSAAAPMSGSLTHLASAAASTPFTTAQTTTSKIYETDIL